MDLPRISGGKLTDSILEVRHEVLARLMRGRCHARLENPGFTSCQFNGIFATAEKSTFKQTHHWCGVFFVEFTNAVVSGFTKVWMQGTVLFVMDAPRVVVGVDLEWHQTQSIEAGRLDNRHVVGGPHRGARHIGSSTHPKVRNTVGQNSASNGFDQAYFVQLLDQPECVAASDVYTLGRTHRRHRIGYLMDALQVVSGVQSSLIERRDVPVVISQGVRHNQDGVDLTKVRLHFGHQSGFSIIGAEAARTKKNLHDMNLAGLAGYW